MSVRELIPMLDPSREVARLEDDLREIFAQVLRHGKFINGPEVQEFEATLATSFRTNVISCANGTDALQIALMALGLEPGDEVILPAFTYAAAAEVIALLKLKPIFADVDYDTFTISPSHIESLVGTKTKAMLPVHLFGQNANMAAIMEIATRFNLFVIEDAAQSIGATYEFEGGDIKYSGCIGDVGCTSFFPTKNLGAFGDGGAIFSNNPMLAQRLRMIANHGQSEKYVHEMIGCNSRLDTLQAAILQRKFTDLDTQTKRRQQLAMKYSQAFEGLGNLSTPKVEPNSSHVYHQYVVRVMEGRRNDLKMFLAERNISSMVYYPKPLHKQKAYVVDAQVLPSLPISNQLCEEVLALPIFPDLSDLEQDFIIESVFEFFSE